jgi:hypothetical protein
MWVILVIPVLIMVMALAMENVESRLGIVSSADTDDEPGLSDAQVAAVAAAAGAEIPDSRARTIRMRDTRLHDTRSRDTRFRDTRSRDARLHNSMAVTRPRATA